MNFVYPYFLWALLLIAIPIIIHLFNFRRYKTVYFSRVSFLREVTEDSKSGTKLKHLLVLISRILAIICLVLAFAQPFIPLDNTQSTENVTSIYIDNSYSMQAEGKDGNLLNEAKNKAINLVRSLDENEKINLVTADMLSIHQRFYSKAEVIDMIKAITFSARTTPLSNVLNLQADLFNSLESVANKRIFLFSDFQKSSNTLDNWSRPEIPTFIYQTTAENPGNIYIDSVWFETPVHRINTPIDIHFRVQNNTDKDVSDLAIQLSIEGNNPGPKRLQIPAHSFIDDKITYTDKQIGFRTGSLKLNTSQLFFDDEFFFSYSIKEEVKILLMTDNNDKIVNIEQLYNLDDYYNCQTTTIGSVSMDDFEDKEFIIFQNVNTIPSGLTDLADKAIEKGASVAFIPGNKIDQISWSNITNKYLLPSLGSMDSMHVSLGYFNSGDPLYTGVFEGEPDNFKLPRLHAAYRIGVSSNNKFITLFGTNENNPYLMYNKFNNGRVILATAPLDLRYTDFQNHALFAATFLRFAETATFQSPLYMEIGSMYNYPLKNEVDEKSPIHLRNPKLEVDIIPQYINSNGSRSISFNHMEDQLKTAGIYDLTDDKDFTDKLAINYDRNESVTETFSLEEIKLSFENVGWNHVEELSVSDSGTIEINKFQTKEYWRILLILALIFLAIEILLLKFWKT
ncbi:MAG: BatA and WFA domain-containing protein [Crocinitomicaceae bacterium]